MEEWDWGSDGLDFVVIGAGTQQSDFSPAVPFSEEWGWDDADTVTVIPGGSQQTDTVQPDPNFSDIWWTSEDDAWEQWFLDERPVGANFVPPAAMPYNHEWHQDDGTDEWEGTSSPVVTNVATVVFPPQNDDWDWNDEVPLVVIGGTEPRNDFTAPSLELPPENAWYDDQDDEDWELNIEDYCNIDDTVPEDGWYWVEDMDWEHWADQRQLPGDVLSVGGIGAAVNANDTSTATGDTAVRGDVIASGGNDTGQGFGGAAGGGVLGFGAATNSSDFATGSGNTAVNGTVNVTNANDTGTGFGSLAIVGVGNATNQNDVTSAYGYQGDAGPTTTRLPLTGIGQ